MIVGQGDPHDRTDHDLAVADYGLLLDAVQAEDAALRRIKDRRGKKRAVDAAVGYRKRAAG